MNRMVSKITTLDMVSSRIGFHSVLPIPFSYNSPTPTLYLQFIHNSSTIYRPSCEKSAVVSINLQCDGITRCLNPCTDCSVAVTKNKIEITRSNMPCRIIVNKPLCDSSRTFFYLHAVKSNKKTHSNPDFSNT